MEHLGANMGIQIPAVGYWPESCLGHVCVILEPVGSTHLRFGDARVVEILVCGNPKVVRSPRRQEEFRNGLEVKIYI